MLFLGRRDRCSWDFCDGDDMLGHFDELNGLTGYDENQDNH